MIELKFDLFEGEVWKEIKDYENLYIISNKGRLACKSQKAKAENQKFFDHLIYVSPLPTGYLQVKLWKNATYRHFMCHRLVAKAFIPNPDNKPEVNHLDGNKLNNEVSNLEWVTAKENNTHALNLGLKNNSGGIQKTSKSVLQITSDKSIIKEFSAIREASKITGIDRVGISKTCKGKQNGAGGYFWCFKQDYNPDTITIKIGGSHGSKMVEKVDIATGEVVEEYISASEAERKNGMTYRTLAKRIENKTKFKKHIYRYKY